MPRRAGYPPNARASCCSARARRPRATACRGFSILHADAPGRRRHGRPRGGIGGKLLRRAAARYGRAEVQGRPVPPVPFGSIANPIAMMEREHGSAGDALGEIRRLTNDFELPPYACSTVRALYLHVHIHLEKQHPVPADHCAAGRPLPGDARRPARAINGSDAIIHYHHWG